MHTTIKRTIILAALLIACAATSQAADWNMPLTVSSGVTRTGVVIGISDNATNGYDNGYDAQNPFTDELLNAWFSHPEWNLVRSGKPVSSFYRDVRGAIPQNFILTVKTTLSPLTISWERTTLPATINATISDGSATADMQKATSFTFNPSGQTTNLTISVTNGDSTPPAVPNNLKFAIKDSSIYLSWDANTEPDLKGYRLHFFGASGDLLRTLDLKQATNYNMLNVEADVPYSIGVSAYDTTGNESERSSIISAVRATPPPPPPAPEATPEPTPQPTTVPEPTPVPVAEPVPSPTSVTVLTPEPAPAPVPVAPTPAPVTPVPVLTPVPAPIPAPDAPVSVPVAATPVQVTPVPVPTPVTAPITVAADGDIDGDGLTSIVDAIKILRMALGLEATAAAAKGHGDMDGDNKLTIRDALIVLRKSVGM